MDKALKTTFEYQAQRAAEAAEDGVGQVLHRHYAKLKKNPRATDGLLKRVDYVTPSLTLDTVLGRVKYAMDGFRDETLRRVHDVPSLIKACEAFAISENYTLFFYSNDEVSAGFVRDYLQDFVNESIISLKARHLMTPEEAEKLRNTAQYLSDGIEGYRCFCDYLETMTEPSTRSLIAFERSQHPAHVMDPDAVELGTADGFIFNKAMKRFPSFIKQFGISCKSGLPPQYFYLGALADHLALERVRTRQGGVFDWDDKQQLRVRFQERVNILAPIEGATGEDDMHRQTALIGQYRDMLRKEMHVHGDMRQIMGVAVARAEAAAVEAFKALPAADPNEVMHSKWLYSIINIGSAAREHESLVTMLKEFREELPFCASPSAVANSVQKQAMGMGGCILLGGRETRMCEVAKAYFVALRMELEQHIDAQFPANRNALAAIRNSERVLAMTGDSLKEAAGWLFHDSDGGWDRYYAKAQLMLSGETGKRPDMFTDDELEMVLAIAGHDFSDACRQRGLANEKLHHPLMPYLYARAFEVAEAQAQQKTTPKPGAGFVARYADKKSGAAALRRLPAPPKGTPAHAWGESGRAVLDPQAQDEELYGLSGAGDDSISAAAARILQQALKQLQPAGKKGLPKLARVESVLAVADVLEAQLRAAQDKGMGRLN